MDKQDYLKGRGAQKFINNRFDTLKRVNEHIEGIDEEDELNGKTSFTNVFPKTILNEVKSPDVPANYSLNPYQGCEHGCIYCYARNSHEYWGYNSGLDFERKILVKANAADLLRKAFKKKSYQPETIMLSGNTDCYQPIEKELKITRSLLEVCLEFQHPVGIITKNALVTRDIDLLSQLAKNSLAEVIISITSLEEEVRRALEPRTSTARKKLEAIRELTGAGVPVTVLMAPIIPALNSMEIPDIAKAASEHGAIGFAHQIVRLNGTLGELFTDWAQKNFPDRAQKIIHQTEEMHGGKLNDNRFGTRMKGEGAIAKQISDLMKIARKKYFTDKKHPELRTDLFNRDADNNQLKMEF